MARVKFGPFEFDPQSGLLWKYGLRIKLQPKSAGVLAALLEKPGEVVTREQIQARLWPVGTFVDFDRSINVAVKRLRDALSDATDEPIYLATVPGEGYRFIAPVMALPVSIPPEMAAATTAPPSGVRRRTLLWASVATSLILVFGIGIFFARRRPAVQFHSRDWVLIADFDNRTGEKLLDGTLEYAMERELSNSEFVNVVPRERLQDALRLMNKPLDAKLDRATAREVCLRDGAIKAVLAGRVEKIGTNYELSVQIVDPVRDVAVASYTEEDPADTLLAGTVRKLSSRVREALGEQVQAIQLSTDQLEKVTTPSLHALQLYTQADRTITQDGNGDQIAAELLEQSLREDPKFASAHMLLGYAYYNQRKFLDAAPHFRRAFELADTTTERERYFILASYYGHPPVNQPEKAAELYETLLRRYPDHRWALNNLANLYLRMEKGKEYDDLRLRLAALRPNDLHAQLSAGWVLVWKEMARPYGTPPTFRWTPDFHKAEDYLNKAVALRNAQGNEEPGFALDGSPRLFAAEIRWMEGKFAESRANVVETERFGRQLEQNRPYMLAPYFATYGNLHEAERRAATEPEGRLLVLLAYFRGDLDHAKTLLRARLKVQSRRAASPGTAVMMANLGLCREAEAEYHRILAEQPKSPSQIPPRLAWVKVVVEGEVALAKGDTAKGTQILDEGLATAKTTLPLTQMAYEDLARAYVLNGRRKDALRVLERAAYGPTMVSDLSAMLQERVQWRLAQLYREFGRTKDAERIEALLRAELAFADPDHPILRQIAALSKEPATVARQEAVHHRAIPRN